MVSVPLMQTPASWILQSWLRAPSRRSLERMGLVSESHPANPISCAQAFSASVANCLLST